MSCEIIYDKAFIKVESGIIPMVCSGSSNCMEFTVRGRRVRERNWFVFKPSSVHKNIFSIAEIQELADDYEKIISESGGGICKGYYKPFAAGEFKKWFLAGLKSAMTIEEYAKAGNSFVFTAQNYSIKNTVTNEADLKKLLAEYAEDATVKLFFLGRYVNKPYNTYKKRVKTDYSKLSFLYVLKAGGQFMWKLTPSRILYTCSLRQAKKFVTEKKAKQYIKKYADRLKKAITKIEIFRIENKNAV